MESDASKLSENLQTALKLCWFSLKWKIAQFELAG